MLSAEALNTSVPLAELLDNSGFALLPVQGSPLEHLVNATRSDVSLARKDNTGQFTVQTHDIEYLANAKDSVLNICKHDMAMDDVVDTVAKAVTGHIAFARNVVRPTIIEFVERVKQSLANITPSTLLGMNIVIHEDPKPLLNNSIENLVRKYEEVPFDIPRIIMNLPALSAAEIRDIAMTGSGGLDKDISEWLSIKGDDFVLYIWDNLFQIKQNSLNAPNLAFDDYTERNKDAIDNALLIFLLSNKLFNKPLENTQMSLPTFEKTIVEYRNQSAARICRALDQIDNVNKNKTLIRNTNDRTIVVNGNVYKQWIEDGGDNEVLFGNLLDQPMMFTVANINEKASEFKSKWLRYAALTSTVEANKRFARTKEILKDEFYKQLKEVKEENEYASNIETVRKLFNEQLDNVGEADIADIYNLCLKLVCRSRFYKTDAESILVGIERVVRENPNIHVREAATISVIEYIAKWVASQMKPISI